MIPKRLPTVREIAKASGFSIHTVSFALRDHPRASKAAREKIQQIAKEMGWKPNPMVSAYMAHFRATKEPSFQSSLGFLVSSAASGQIAGLPVYQRRFYQGAEERGAALGYSLQPIWLHEPGLTSARLTQILRSRGIRGLIVPSLIDPTEILEGLDWSQFAAVAGGYMPRKPILDKVSGHLIHGVHLLLRKALELGYQRIGVIFSKNIDDRMDHGVFYPIYYEQKQKARAQRIKYHCYTWPLTTSGESGIRKWIEREKPDIVIGQPLALSILQEMKWDIPEDVAFAAIEWSPDKPQIAGLNQMQELRGAMAVDLVSAELLRNETGIPAAPKLLLVEGHWEDGASAPPRAAV